MTTRTTFFYTTTREYAILGSRSVNAQIDDGDDDG